MIFVGLGITGWLAYKPTLLFGATQKQYKAVFELYQSALANNDFNQAQQHFNTIRNYYDQDVVKAGRQDLVKANQILQTMEFDYGPEGKKKFPQVRTSPPTPNDFIGYNTAYLQTRVFGVPAGTRAAAPQPMMQGADTQVFQDQIAQLKQENQMLSKKNTELDETHTHNTVKWEELWQKSQSSDKSIEQLNAQLQAAQTQIQQAELTASQAQATAQAAQRAEQSALAQAADATALLAKGVDAKTAAITQENTTLRTENAALQTANAQLTASNAALVSQINSLTARLVEVTQKINQK